MICSLKKNRNEILSLNDMFTKKKIEMKILSLNDMFTKKK